MSDTGGSEKLTKRAIALYVMRKAQTERAMNLQDAQSVVGATLKCIATALAQGKTIELRNFGVFDVVTRKARVGRNPKMPEVTVHIPAMSKVRFRAGKEMKEGIKHLLAHNPVPTGLDQKP